jgi:hypothetical protein
MAGVVGVTVRDTSVAGVTVKFTAAELTPLSAAVTAVPPELKAVARPPEPAALLIDATAGFAEVHVTLAERFCVEWSVYTPVAVNCCVVPATRLELAGVTLIETSVAAVTVSGVLPETPAWLALIVVDPAISVLAKPEASIVATCMFEELQPALVEISCCEPSLYCAVAMNCVAPPAATLVASGVTAIVLSVGLFWLVPPELPEPPQAASMAMPTMPAPSARLRRSRAYARLRLMDGDGFIGGRSCMPGA